MPQQIDYDKLARDAGAISVGGGGVDYDALAAKAGAIGMGSQISPTLLASRQAASKSDFEKNLPENQQGLIPGFIRGVTKSVAGLPVGAANLALGGAEAVRGAIDPYGFLPKVPQVPESANYAVEPMTPAEEKGDLAGNVGMTAQALMSGGAALYRKLSTGADPATIKAIRNIRQLSPTTAEAQATAGRIANEALTRGSVPEAPNLAVRDSKVFRGLLDAEQELQQAKAATSLAQQTVDGKKLLQDLDAAIAKNQVPGAVNPQYGMPTTSAQGGAVQPITSYAQADPAMSGRAAGLTKARQQIAALVDNNGNIRADRLQQFKEIVDKDIFDHSGWRDTGTAADKSNLQAMREANGYVRQALRDLGNTRLNAANDAFSHQSDVAKIVDIRRPDLAGLSTADKIPAALVPMKGTPASQFARATLKRAAPYAIPGALLLGAEELHRATKP